jgi:hypothetical protein
LTVDEETEVVPVGSEQAKLFLGANADKTFPASTYYVGSKASDGILRALMVLNWYEGMTLNIMCYKSVEDFPDYFSDLLAYATQMYSPEAFCSR